MQTNALLRSKSRVVVTLNSSMTLYSWLVNTAINISVDCVVPENIHTTPPPQRKGMEIPGSGVVQGHRNFWRGGWGWGGCLNEFLFYPDRSQFSYCCT